MKKIYQIAKEHSITPETPAKEVKSIFGRYISGKGSRTKVFGARKVVLFHNWNCNNVLGTITIKTL